jgi:hypothetical protein
MAMKSLGFSLAPLPVSFTTNPFLLVLVQRAIKKRAKSLTPRLGRAIWGRHYRLVFL